MSHVEHLRVRLHQTPQWWMSHVTLMNEACPTYGWVMSHIWISHVPHMNESYRTNKGTSPSRVRTGLFATYRRLISRSSKVNESYELVLSHIWMSHVPHMNESCPTYQAISRKSLHIMQTSLLACSQLFGLMSYIYISRICLIWYIHVYCWSSHYCWEFSWLLKFSLLWEFSLLLDFSWSLEFSWLSHIP